LRELLGRPARSARCRSDAPPGGGGTGLAPESDVEKQNSDGTSLFSLIRVYFSDIVEDVIDRKALFSVGPNQRGRREFRAEILDESGNATSADLGHTYRKHSALRSTWLCCADM
jgi:uncharacterized protein YydD (DUF2326 family)